MIAALDRRRGMLLGLAVGDALGASVEFASPGTFEPVTGYRDGGPHDLRGGEWTDDTSMALALAESIAEVGWDLDDQAQRYVAWWRTGRYSSNGRVFDIGQTTVAALCTFIATGDARRSGARRGEQSGNGSLMRLAPVPMRYANFFPDRLAALVERATESSLPTHASPQCLSACAYLAVALAALVQGVPREDVLAADWDGLMHLRRLWPLHPEVDAVAGGSFAHRTPPDIVGSGYVVKTLEAALWAFHGATDFREAVLRAVNLGNDADTTGAVAGQLAGAYWGASGIPGDWVEGLASRDLIEDILGRLVFEGL